MNQGEIFTEKGRVMGKDFWRRYILSHVECGGGKWIDMGEEKGVRNVW